MSARLSWCWERVAERKGLHSIARRVMGEASGKAQWRPKALNCMAAPPSEVRGSEACGWHWVELANRKLPAGGGARTAPPTAPILPPPLPFSFLLCKP